MSKLLAYNLTGAPLTLAAGNPVVPDLPASAAPPARGPAVNVTVELDGLSAGDYTALQAQAAAGDVAYIWDGAPDYDTGDLVAQVASGGSAIETYVITSTPADVDDVKVFGDMRTLFNTLDLVPGPKTVCVDSNGGPVQWVGDGLNYNCSLVNFCGTSRQSDVNSDLDFADGPNAILTTELRNFGGGITIHMRNTVDSVVKDIRVGSASNTFDFGSEMGPAPTWRQYAGAKPFLDVSASSGTWAFRNAGTVRLGDAGPSPAIEWGASGVRVRLQLHELSEVTQSMLAGTNPAAIVEFAPVAPGARWGDQSATFAGVEKMTDSSKWAVPFNGPNSNGGAYPPVPFTTGGQSLAHNNHHVWAGQAGIVVQELPEIITASNGRLAVGQTITIDNQGDFPIQLSGDLGLGDTIEGAAGAAAYTVDPGAKASFRNDGSTNYYLWAEAGLLDQATTIVYRPGATGLRALGNNVYVGEDLAGFTAMMAAAAAATSFGLVNIEWDAEDSSHLNGYGDPACPIPAGAWDFLGIVWVGLPQFRSSFAANGNARVDILEGADITNLKKIAGDGTLVVTYDGTTVGPIKLGNYLEVACACAFSNTNVGAGDMFTSTGGSGIISFNTDANFGGLGGDVTGRADAVAPLCDTSNGNILVLQQGPVTIKQDMASGSGSFSLLKGIMADAVSRLDAGTYEFPTLLADGGSGAARMRYPAGPRLDVAKTIDSGDSPFTLDRYAGLILVETSLGPVTVQLPQTGVEGFSVFDEVVYIYDADGMASQNPITVLAHPGESIAGDTQRVIAEDRATLGIVAGGGQWNLHEKLATRAQGAQTGAAPTLGTIATGAEEGPLVAAQAGWKQESMDGERSTGSITAIVGANLIDTETFVIDDGNGAITFEFDSNASVVETPTLRAVVFTGGDADTVVAAAIAAAIEGSALQITTVAVAAVVALVGPSATAANVVITKTVADGGFVVTGMAGATPGKVGWTPIWF